MELVVIGSSIVRYIDANKIERRRLAQTERICLPGGKVNDIKNEIGIITTKYNVKKLIIHVGGNNVPRDSPDNVTKMIKDMLIYTKEVMPQTKMYFSSILPRTNEAWISGIDYINTNIQDFCRNNNILFIQHPQFFIRNGIAYDLLKPDVIHPNYKGTAIFAKNIIAKYRNYGR